MIAAGTEGVGRKQKMVMVLCTFIFYSNYLCGTSSLFGGCPWSRNTSQYKSWKCHVLAPLNLCLKIGHSLMTQHQQGDFQSGASDVQERGIFFCPSVVYLLWPLQLSDNRSIGAHHGVWFTADVVSLASRPDRTQQYPLNGWFQAFLLVAEALSPPT